MTVFFHRLAFCVTLAAGCLLAQGPPPVGLPEAPRVVPDKGAVRLLQKRAYNTEQVAPAAQTDPREIIRHALANDVRNARIEQTYTYLRRQETRFVKPDGSVKSTSSKTYDVTPQEGSPYLRLVKKNDQPLSPGEDRKEQQKLWKSIEERKRETPSQREKRIKEAERDRAQERALDQEVLDMYDFRLIGEEAVDGRDAFLIAGEPRPGYKSRHEEIKRLAKFRLRFWIDQADVEVSKAELEAIETVSFGWLLVRLPPGTLVHVELARVDREVWLLRRLFVDAKPRVLFFKPHLQIEWTCTNFRKFQADSRILPATEQVK